MQILLSGIGSIGKRHLDNLWSLGFQNIILHRSSGVSLPDYPQLQVHTSLQECLLLKPQVAIIAQPTFLHTPIATALAAGGVPYLFIEKPLAHNWQGVDALLQTTKDHQTRTTIGFDLRFDPGFIYTQQLLQANAIGSIISIHAEVGQYLPDWRTQQDYRQGMSASTHMGGGVMLDLIHEFDYITALAGPVAQVASMYGKISPLQIETEDVANILFECSSGALATLRMDYLQKNLSRNCKIIGTNGTLFWDYAAKTVAHSTYQQPEPIVFSYTHFNRNDRFVTEMKTLMDNVENKKDGLVNIAAGADVLKLVLAAKHSYSTRTFVGIQTFTPTQ